MEKLKRHQQIVKAYLQELLDMRHNLEGIKTEFIKDDEGYHYQMVNVGWRNKQRIYGCFLHIDLDPVTGKVWIEHDGTDLGVAEVLVERGIDRQDIVLGFRAPYYRQYTNFAEA